MNNRDQAINELAGQYAEFAQKEDATKKSLYMNREQFEFLEVRYMNMPYLVGVAAVFQLHIFAY